MATNYPGALDSLTNPTSSDNLSSPTHSSQHANANDAIEAIQSKIGIGSGTPTTGAILQSPGAGSSTWLPVGSNGQVLTTNGTTVSWGASTAGLMSTTQYGPQSFGINYKIITSVSSNNLTVAIKGMDGNDPSSSNPVYIRIGDTVRTITSALSVTKNAGTNWFNSGSQELAAQEVDYFVYLGYNTTDGVVLGFARIPYARKYGDFSTTTTNDYYAAISTITNATSTDVYENIGRFNATLSASASYNWSIPATSIIINRPIHNTRKLSYTPFLGAVAPIVVGTTSDKVGSYLINLDTFSFSASMIQAKSGTAQTFDVYMSIPLTITSMVPNQAYGFANMDNKFGQVAAYGSSGGGSVQFRAAVNFDVDSVGRGCSIGATGIAIP